MNFINKTLLVMTSLILFSFNASAHDPKEHAKTAEKANCSSVDKMKEQMEKENKKMDMKDPIVIAMMKKCEQQKMDHQSESKSQDEGHHDNHPQAEVTPKKEEHSDDDAHH